MYIELSLLATLLISRVLNIYMDSLSDFSEGVQDFRVIGEPLSWVEVRIHQFVIVAMAFQFPYKYSLDLLVFSHCFHN